jgi:O-antigen polymerase
MIALIKDKTNWANLIIFILLFLILGVSLIKTDYFLFQTLTSQVLYFSVVSSVIIICFSFFSKVKQIKVSYSDYLLVGFYLYNLGNILFSKLEILNERFILLTLLISLYILNKHFLIKSETKYRRYEILIILVISYIHLSIGVLQVGHRLYNSSQPIISTFDHTTTFSNYVASVFPLIFGICFYYSSPGKKVIFYTFFFLAIGLIACLTERTVIVSCVLVIIVFLFYKSNHIIPYLQAWFSRNKLSGFIVLFTILFFSYTMFVFLLGYRPLSFLGRVFIWGISLNAIRDNPIVGYGFDSFQAVHNKYQLIYFSKNLDINSYQFLVGDNIAFAFNEFIQFYIELGITGLLLFVLFVIAIIRIGMKSLKSAADQEKKSLLMVLLGFSSILICSLFSYPLQRLPVMINFFLFASILSSYEKKGIVINLRKVWILPVTVLFVFIIYITGDRAFAYHDWKTGYDSIRKGDTGDGLAIYKKNYNSLKYNKYFLYNYGMALAQNFELERSIEILKQAKEKIFDADIFIQLGIIHEKLMDFNQAEFCYTQAIYLKPHLFEPRYKLFKMYAENINKKDDAIRIARDIANMPVKVQSGLILQIKSEIKNYLVQNGCN